MWYEKKYKDVYPDVFFKIREGEILMECDEKYYKHDLIDGVSI